jgi:dihydroflavonol-4-reductase
MKKSNASKVLVTGGTGFLGRALMDHLQEKGEKHVRVLTTAPQEWLQESGVEVIEGSITSPEMVAVALEGVKHVYHLAGRVSRNEDEQRPMYSVHVDGTRILCEAARKAGVKRIVMA